MKLVLTTALVAMSALYCAAQGARVKSTAQEPTKIIGYYTKEGSAVTDVKQAHFWRTATQVDSLYTIVDYFTADSTVRMRGTCSQLLPYYIFEGQCTWYYQNGKKSTETFFVKGERDGLSRWYYEDGSPQWALHYKKGKKYYAQYWTNEGTPQLNNGTGLIAARDNQLPHTQYTEVKDSVLVRHFEVTDQPQDTVYIKADVDPMFQGGMNMFYSKLARSIVYPPQARDSEIQGQVMLSFIVDKQGNAIDVKVEQGIGYGCDEAALTAFHKQKGWMPATYQGKPVKMRMRLPVKFALEY
jgi:TonB family protein